MDRKQYLILEQSKPLIIDNIDGKHLLDSMVEAAVFSIDDDDEIRSHQTRKTCAEKFYEKLLCSKHKKTYATFKSALEASDAAYIVEELEKLEKKYENEPEASLPNPRPTGGHGISLSSSSSGNYVYVKGDRNNVVTGSTINNMTINLR